MILLGFDNGLLRLHLPIFTHEGAWLRNSADDRFVMPAGELWYMDFDHPHPSPFHYRSGDVWIPKIDYREPLQTEVKHFIDCIHTGKEALSGPNHSLKVIKILEEATNS